MIAWRAIVALAFLAFTSRLMVVLIYTPGNRVSHLLAVVAVISYACVYALLTIKWVHPETETEDEHDQ